MEDIKELQKLEQDAKNEIGLGEVPYENLHLYKVNTSSVTGKEGEYISAKDYVDNYVKQIEDAKELLKTMGLTESSCCEGSGCCERNEKEKEPEVWMPQAIAPLITPIEPTNLPVENYRYFDLTTGPNNYTAVIYLDTDTMDDDRIFDIQSQIEQIKNHWTFVAERNRSMLTGFEVIINYYQWANLVGSLRDDKNDLTKYENIADRMDTVFSGLKFPEGF